MGKLKMMNKKAIPPYLKENEVFGVIQTVL